jgi:hypothetical protein
VAARNSTLSGAGDHNQQRTPFRNGSNFDDEGVEMTAARSSPE